MPPRGSTLDVEAIALFALARRRRRRLAEKISRGTKVRLCLGDPECDAVALRGREEGVGDGMASRCRLAANYASAVQRADPEGVRTTTATLYSSIFRFDDEVLVNNHLWGSAASDAPVLHLRRRGDRGIAASALRSFDRVWGNAQPLPTG